jgi:DNA topoisomerase-2
VLSNKARYIQEILNDTIDLRKKKKEQVTDMLVQKGYSTIDDDEEFRYLVKMSMDSVTEENVDKINKERADKENELHIVESTTIQQMWLHELSMLEEEYLKYKDERMRTNMDHVVVAKKVTKKKAL